MAEEVKDAPTTEDKVVEKTETTVETPKKEETPTPEPQKTIGEMAEDGDPTPERRVVDEHVFVAEKKARKKAERDLKALRESIESGASDAEVSDSIDDIADEYDIDAAFLKKFATSIKTQTEKELDAKYASKAGEKERAEKFDTAFDAAYKTALERGPEFKAVANPQVIKSLARLPENSRKTVSQLLEETYGNALTGKRTIETAKPGGGKDPEPLDFMRARKDQAYFKEVMADPERKKEYNKKMLEEGF
jgi:hypothetical protein